MTQEPAGDPVDLTIRGAVAVLSLNRPRVRNAINDAMRTALVSALDRVAGDDAIRALVLTGNGSAFCAGGDIAGMRERLDAPPGDVAFNGWRRQRRTHGIVAALHGLSKPTIAAVNGPAAGLGCDLALCCDFILASDQASFVMSFILRGLVPDGGGMYFLPRRVGLSRAKDLIFTGRKVEAEEALRMGLADRVTAASSLLSDAEQWAAELGRAPSAALALSKSILDRSFELSEEQVFALGREAQAICYTSTDHRAAVAAFLDKTAR
jgi:enoyl-CoA hydratase/carnithine racemase